MKEITVNDKMDELYDLFAAAIGQENTADISAVESKDKTVKACAKICAKIVRDELEHYAGKNPVKEIRPHDLSGRDFWKQIEINFLNG